MNISSVPYQRSENHGLIQPPVFVNKVSLKCSQLFVSGCFPTGLPRWLTTCRCRRHERHQFHPWVAGSLEEGRQPTPVLLPGESHGQRSLVGYSPWGCKESDTTERLSTQPCFPTAIVLAVVTETTKVKVLPLRPLMKKPVSPRPGGLTSSLQNHKVSRIAGVSRIVGVSQIGGSPG